MSERTQTRKKRNDRNYVVYAVSSENNDDFYIGITVAIGRAFLKSVKIRVQKHISRANRESKNWAFCEFLRKNPEVQYEVIEVIRGRKPAYQRERQLIAELQPTLNTF